jgi:DNA-binding NtrC family response regulator
VDAMKKGAYDYLRKPFELEELRLTVQRALSYTDALSENVYLRKQLKRACQFNQIIGASAVMKDVFKTIERVADTDSTVLLLGESGTGKELVARALHFNSKRRFAPFVPINCSALPEHLLESELFGHRRGSFTGAINDKKGLFQEADGGTILLDEIGTMSAVLQSRLLRVLQDREVRRVGDNTPIYVNVRVVAATNEPLEERIKDNTFREDLYDRLNVIPMKLPPLRDRPEDIPLLVAHFLANKVHARSGKPFQLTRLAMAALVGHAWPGNVRELENAIQRACALSETEVIKAAELPSAIKTPAGAEPDSEEVAALPLPLVPNAELFPPPSTEVSASGPKPAELPSNQPVVPLKNFLRDQEQAYLNRTLAQVNGDKEKAAEILGVSLATLYRKLAGEG